MDDLLLDVLRPLGIPRHPMRLAQFGMHALQSCEGLASRHFRHTRARALFAGMAAHAMLPLKSAATASFGLVLGMVGHAVGWPLAKGGSSALTRALVSCLSRAGGELHLGHNVRSRRDLPSARAYVFDSTPKQLLRILDDAVPRGYRRRLERFRYGLGVFKMDWALSGPVPWTDERCARAATVHLSGTLPDVSAAELAVHRERAPLRPFIVFVQPTVADSSRAPAGHHVAWAYCHVPANSSDDWSAAIEGHIEEHAPGFRARVLARACKNPQQLELYNPNCVGGDINGGMANLSQLFFRPVVSADPYATAIPNVFLCSSSAPPGGGVHGLCGYYAARSVMRRVFHGDLPDLA